MTISAKVIEGSMSSVTGKELWTLELRYPRFIHAEFMTHRVFSRNASSSRAIPVERLIADVKCDLAGPISWGKNVTGMQAKEELSPKQTRRGERMWRASAYTACLWAGLLGRLGAHKQIVNRVIEPYSHINVVVTATEWDNFFALRAHKDAQPEIMGLAIVIREAMESYKQLGDMQTLAPGDWHLPYVTELERTIFTVEAQKQVSTARCARVSYKTHDGRDPHPTEDITLYERLVGSEPFHASPTEHQATPLTMDNLTDQLGYSNLVDWFQFRKELE